MVLGTKVLPQGTGADLLQGWRNYVDAGSTFILKRARVIDPALGIDRITDIAVADGRIKSVGEADVVPSAPAINLEGLCLSPGWIDIHVHVYGTLGFANPDSIGVYQGVTSFIEAGGPGFGTLDQFVALLDGQTATRLYAGPLAEAMGLIGLNFEEKDARTLGDLSISKCLDFMQQHPGLLRYLKANAHGYGGPGPLKISKGLAEVLELPWYVHVGEFQNTTPNPPLAFEAFRLAEAGDIITHIFHNNLGRITDTEGRLLPVVREAERRGVLFDLGFGAYNFSWTVAEKAFAQGLVPHVISSDLQQFNVTGPTYSLANVMSVMLRLGLGLAEVVERVTSSPAKALALSDRAGALKPGAPADITVFRLEHGQFELADTSRQRRTADTRIVPVMAFVQGTRFDCDLSSCQDEENWLMQVVEDRIPSAADDLSELQLEFLAALAAALRRIDWDLPSPQLDLAKATELQDAFHGVRRQHRVALADALRAVYKCFLDRPFMMQIGLFIIRLDRAFALCRLEEVAGRAPARTRRVVA
jgi:dihydroorotase